MPVYNASNGMAGTLQALTTTSKTQLSLTGAGSTPVVARVNELKCGPAAAPNATDCEIVWVVNAQTTVGTGTSVTPLLLGTTRGGASSTVGTANHTVEPTITTASVYWDDGFNQRQGFIWQALPGQELIIPATSSNGVGIRAKSSTYTGTVTASANFLE